jgi:hypothetical protein
MNVEKIQKLIRLLSSPNDGEVVATVHALMRALKADGTDIHALAERISAHKQHAGGRASAAASPANAAPSHLAMARAILRMEHGRLSPKQRDFVVAMVSWCALREPTERQAQWLHAIYCKIGRPR